ncbi:bifunctional diguanylate cyclase/phosphodiesterase [Simplicispira lacusdiani]|uniref:bifunctional diguanylate cyclase/phosphodiesterase n=1 Tax=Simplicispira lacusdiani TaxID=2213010 RepID=UPI000E72E649|nr:EAL domain-containing protein [Simplicispira lacusdiani]
MSQTSSSFTRHIGYTLAVLMVMAVAFVVYVSAEKTIDVANRHRLQSHLLADEMRQSSDDLTRMARLYVVTGDERFTRNYQHILDIRDGLQARPERYDGSYWDMATATGSAPRPDSERKTPLLELMREAGFTPQEFDLLSQAKARSDGLTRLEREAMQLRQAQGSGAGASHAQALAMLHDANYLAAKASILQPVDLFYGLMTERTRREVEQAERRALFLRWVFVACGLALVFMLYRTARALRAVMGGSVDEVHARITRLGQGDFSIPPQAAGAQPGTVLARLAETQLKLKHMTDERQQAQWDLQRSETRLKEAQRLALIGHWELDLATNVLTWSDETFRIFEIDPAQFQASYDAFLEAIHPDDRELVRQGYARSIESKEPYHLTHRLKMRDGRIKYVHERGETFYDPDSARPLRSIGTVQDITASRMDKLALERANRDLRLLSDCNMALVHAEEEPGLLMEICRLCVERGGYRLAWVGYALHDEARTVRLMAQSGDHDGSVQHLPISWADVPRGRGPVGTAIRTGQPCVVEHIPTDPRMAFWREEADRRGLRSCVALPLVCDATVLGALALYSHEEYSFDPEEIRLLIELASDLAFGITTLRTRVEHAQAKEQLEFLAHFDPLTHLPNRLLLRDRFEHAALVAQSDQSRIALLYMDLDHFKQINDSLGYSQGDQVLVKVVERLRRCVPVTATVCRLSGDEFVVMLAGHQDAPAVAGVAHAIRDALVEPIPIEGGMLNVACSIGIGMHPEDGADFESLLKHAHAALVSAKEAGRNTYRFFSREMNTGMLEQIRLTGGLSSALRNQEFLLHYQPQIDLGSGRITGVEALLRWQHPTDGLVPPGTFIPLAERSGHIVPIGEWVLREACRQGRIWQDRLERPPVVAVNLSALQFKRGNVLDLVSTAIAASGLRPGLLELELTESILLQDVEATIRTLHGLKALGVKLSIDDFGTGYSSLSYLKQLAVDKLKIDQSFVRDMLLGSDGASIVNAVIQLGHNLQLTVIAEGVETDEQRHFLAQAGCDEAQGYWFSRPVPAAQIDALLGEGLSG